MRRTDWQMGETGREYKRRTGWTDGQRDEQSDRRALTQYRHLPSSVALHDLPRHQRHALQPLLVMTSVQKNKGSRPRVIHLCHFFFFLFVKQEQIRNREWQVLSLDAPQTSLCLYLHRTYFLHFLEASQVIIPLLVGVQCRAHLSPHFPLLFFIFHFLVSWHTRQQQNIQIYNIVKKNECLKKKWRIAEADVNTSLSLPLFRLQLIEHVLHQWMTWNDCATLDTLVHTRKHTHTQHELSSILLIRSVAPALGAAELHPANLCRAATGAVPMESQTFQASAKARSREAFLQCRTRSHSLPPAIKPQRPVLWPV